MAAAIMFPVFFMDPPVGWGCTYSRYSISFLADNQMKKKDVKKRGICDIVGSTLQVKAGPIALRTTWGDEPLKLK
jgi:hypothetical protein